MAVWRLSNELDFFRPRVGPSSTGVDGAGGTERHTNREFTWTIEDLVWFSFCISVETSRNAYKYLMEQCAAFLWIIVSL